MDGVSLSKESCRFVEKEKLLQIFFKALTRPCNLSKVTSAKLYFEKEGVAALLVSKLLSYQVKGCLLLEGYKLYNLRRVSAFFFNKDIQALLITQKGPFKNSLLPLRGRCTKAKRPPPDQQLLCWQAYLGQGALSLSSYQPPVCNRHVASFNSVE